MLEAFIISEILVLFKQFSISVCVSAALKSYMFCSSTVTMTFSPNRNYSISSLNRMAVETIALNNSFFVCIGCWALTLSHILETRQYAYMSGSKFKRIRRQRLTYTIWQWENSSDIAVVGNKYMRDRDAKLFLLIAVDFASHLSSSDETSAVARTIRWFAVCAYENSKRHQPLSNSSISILCSMFALWHNYTFRLSEYDNFVATRSTNPDVVSN